MPTAGRWREEWIAIDASRWDLFGPLPDALKLPPPRQGVDDGRGVVLQQGDVTLVGRSRGEWGGEAFAVDARGRATELVDVNVLGFARVGTEVFIVAGLAHLLP